MSDQSPLGRTVEIPERYAPEVLHALDRAPARETIGLTGEAPFHGVDTWNAWEMTWLNDRRRVQVACVRIEVPASSPRMVESKSLKLYLNAFAGSTFTGQDEVRRTITRDLTSVIGTGVTVKLLAVDDLSAVALTPLPGTRLDDLPVSSRHENVEPATLRARAEEVVEETVHSHLFRSQCPITRQPDWASVVIRYRGPRMNHPGLLEYLLSYRHHQGYHENCVERMFVDLNHHCRPDHLSVLALFTRRGGIDINPFRTSDAAEPPPRLRSARQ